MKVVGKKKSLPKTFMNFLPFSVNNNLKLLDFTAF